MLKKFNSILLFIVLLVTLCGCNGKGDIKDAGNTSAVTEAGSNGDAAKASDADAIVKASENNSEEKIHVRVASLKGPTTMGLVNLMSKSALNETRSDYEFTMETQPDQVAALVVSGKADIALVPANLAAVLYNKTKGQIEVIDINTLGVLYCVTGDESVKNIKDLSGKTVILTGQGASPEYVLKYLLEENGITDCNMEFKSEATEIAAILNEDKNAVAILPQPFVTVATKKNNEIKVAFSLNDEWNEVNSQSQLLTGVTIVRKDFAEKNPEAVSDFINDHKESTELCDKNAGNTALLIADYGIIEKKEIAEAALPYCNIVCITNDEMEKALSGYLEVLYNADKSSVGENLPGEDFYYKAK